MFSYSFKKPVFYNNTFRQYILDSTNNSIKRKIDAFLKEEKEKEKEKEKGYNKKKINLGLIVSNDSNEDDNSLTNIYKSILFLSASFICYVFFRKKYLEL